MLDDLAKITELLSGRAGTSTKQTVPKLRLPCWKELAGRKYASKQSEVMLTFFLDEPHSYTYTF